MGLYLPDTFGVIVGSASLATDDDVTGTTPEDVSGLSITYTPVGRPLLFIFNATIYSAAGASMFFRLIEGSTEKKRVAVTVSGATSATLIHSYTPAAGSPITWKIQQNTNGPSETGQINLVAAGLTPADFVIMQG